MSSSSPPQPQNSLEYPLTRRKWLGLNASIPPTKYWYKSLKGNASILIYVLWLKKLIMILFIVNILQMNGFFIYLLILESSQKFSLHLSIDPQWK